MVEPHSSNFRVITTNSLGVRIFRNITVVPDLSFLKLKTFMVPEFVIVLNVSCFHVFFFSIQSFFGM